LDSRNAQSTSLFMLTDIDSTIQFAVHCVVSNIQLITTMSVDKSTLTEALLNALRNNETIKDSHEFLQSQLNHQPTTTEHDTLTSILQSLQSEQILTFESKSEQFYNLSQDAQSYLQDGTPEARVFETLSQHQNVTPQQLSILLPDKTIVQLGSAQLMKSKIISIDRQNGGIYVLNSSMQFTDSFRQLLETVASGKASSLDAASVNELKKRKCLVQSTRVRHVNITKGLEFNSINEKKSKITDLTHELLQSSKWQQCELKEYNFNALGSQPQFGTFHPLMKVRSEFRSILLGMGFSEMTTNSFNDQSYL
jgi:phenylalanyl-tRNA synthetase alpha chain